MVRQDRIDLIEEFTEIQNNNDYIVLTTYCFDPFFFDVFLLNKLQANNPASEIVLLVDAVQYEKSYDRFTKDTGRKYHLVPIFMNNGVFHPKFFLFLSESEKKLTLYVGSGNVTLPGFTRNAELVSKIEYSLTENQNVGKILEILKGLVNKNFVNEQKPLEILQEVTTTIISNTSNAKDELGCSILHNLEEPILLQLLNKLKGKKFKELFMLAPFLSQKPQVLEELVNNVSVEKVVLALQKNNHNLNDVSSYRKLLSAKGISFEMREAKFEEPERRFHSKILHLDGSEQYLLVGSPNITNYALLETTENGNFECAVLYNNPKVQKILNGVCLTETRDLNALLKTAEPKEEVSKSNLLKIYSADFDDVKRILNVKTEKISEEAVVLVSIENPNKIIKRDLKLDRGEFNVDIPQGTPKELTITCSDKSSRRRIFHDKNYFLKRIVRSPASFKEISDRLYNNLSIDISDLMALLGGLSKSLEIGGRAGGRIVGKGSSKFPRPSRIRGIYEASSLLKALRDLHDWLNFKNQETRELEESYSNGDLEEGPRPQYPRYLDEEVERKRLINKIIDKLNEIILLSASRSIDENATDSLVNSQSIFIDCSLRMFRKIVDREIFDNFKEALENNLESVRREDCSKDSLVKLFSLLLLLSYCCKHKRAFYSFGADLFSYSDLIDKTTYFKIKKHTKEFVERYYNERGFNIEEFMKYYSNLLECNVFSARNIDVGTIETANRIFIEQDSEFVRFLGEILLAVKYGRFSKDFLLGEIRKIRDKEVTGGKTEGIVYLDKFLE